MLNDIKERKMRYKSFVSLHTPTHSDLDRDRDSNGMSELQLIQLILPYKKPLIQLTLPYKISCIRGSSEIPLLSLDGAVITEQMRLQ